MLAAAPADPVAVVYRALTLASIVCCGLVVISFVMFADAQLSSASRHQQRELATGITPTTSSPAPAGEPSQPGRFIDGAAGKLTAPFGSIVQSSSRWVQRGLETVFALAFYGVGLGFLARYSRV
jgi:hypothetical protein